MGHVLLWHLDGRLPNLALMRLAAHHRALGDTVELRRGTPLGSCGTGPHVSMARSFSPARVRWVSSSAPSTPTRSWVGPDGMSR